jgi:hypothetical protein
MASTQCPGPEPVDTNAGQIALRRDRTADLKCLLPDNTTSNKVVYSVDTSTCTGLAVAAFHRA